MDISENIGTLELSILIKMSIINYLIWYIFIFKNTYINIYILLYI